MGEMDESEDREGKRLCRFEDVMRELQKILTRDTQTHFDNATMEETINRWCVKEESKFFLAVGILRSDLDNVGKIRSDEHIDADNLISMAEDVIVNRVVVRILRMIQANRMNIPGGTPNYSQVMADYKTEYERDEHWIKSIFYPFTKKRSEPVYPPSIILEIEAIDDTTDEMLPGARVYVNNEWVSTTWKDGIVEMTLLSIDIDSQDPYEVVLKMVGYSDSTLQEISEAGTYTFRLVPI
jgi:hypothetical protein